MKQFNPNDKTIHDYLAGRLSADEVECFELWLADHPEQLAQVQEELAIKLAVDEIYSVNAKKSENHLQGFLLGIKEKIFYALTGAVVSALAMMFIWQINQPPQIESNIPIFTLSHTRSINQQGFSPVTTIELSKDVSRIVLVSQLVEVNDGLYDVKVRKNNSDQIVLLVENLKPFGLGDLHVAIPAHYLESGDYWLDVTQQANLIDSLPFAVINN